MYFVTSGVVWCNMCKVIFLLSVLTVRTSYCFSALMSSYCQTSQHHYVRDHTDCSVFYVCYRGRAWKMRCSPGTVWSTRYKVCVWDSSAYDDCLEEENSIPSEPPPKQRLLPTTKGKPSLRPTATRPPIRWSRRPIYTRSTRGPIYTRGTRRPIYTRRPPRKKYTRRPVTETRTKPGTTRPTSRVTQRKTSLPPMFFPWTTRPVTPKPTERPKTTKRTTPRPPPSTTTPKPTTPRPRPTTTSTRRPLTTSIPWWRFTTRKLRKTTRRRRPLSPWRTRRPRPTPQKPRRTTTSTAKPTTPKTKLTTRKPPRPPTRRTRPPTRPPRQKTTTPKPLPTMRWRTRPPRHTKLPTVKPTTPGSIYTKPTWNWWSRRVTKRPTTRITRRTTPRTTTTLRTTTLPTTSVWTTTLPTTTTTITRRPTTTTTTRSTTTTTTTRRPTTTTRRTTIKTTRRPTTTSTRKPTTKTSPRRTYPPWRYPPDQCGVVASTMIIGGRPSGPGRWPWQVSLQIIAASDPWHRCGGVLVDPLWVLTAAHCVEGPFYGNARNWRVVLSEDDLTSSSGREVFRRISRIVSHPGYMRASNFPNDIALLQLDEPVDVTGRFVRHACLPDREFELGEDWNCWISGWGETRGTSRRYVLNELEVPLLDNNNCSNMWSRVGIPVLQTQVCVGNGELGACYGDSGGPLMCEVDGVYVLGGVMSWLINNCTARNFPNVFTRVSSYIDWIYYNMDVYNFRRYS